MPRTLGIDEFAFRRGRTYGTILVNLETSRAMDVLPDRESETVTAWLHEHAGAETDGATRARSSICER